MATTNPFTPGALSNPLSDEARRELGNVPFSEIWILTCILLAMDGLYKQSNGSGGLQIPPHDSYNVTYNDGGNVHTITYKLAGTVVATQTFVYDDEASPTGKLQSATITYP